MNRFDLAATIPLDMLERLTDMAGAQATNADDLRLIAEARREIEQVKLAAK